MSHQQSANSARTPAGLEQARLHGAMEAARQLRRLKVDPDRAVDIFRIVAESGLWLLFEPLDDLLAGARSRRGVAAPSPWIRTNAACRWRTEGCFVARRSTVQVA